MLWPRCNQMIPDGCPQCGYCGATFGAPPPGAYGQAGQFPPGANPYAAPHSYPPPHSSGGHGGLEFLIPIGRSLWAVAAGYLGLFSLFFCFLGPVAILCGIVAIVDIQRNPQKLGMPRAIVGIVLGVFSSLGLVFVIGSLIFG